LPSKRFFIHDISMGTSHKLPQLFKITGFQRGVGRDNKERTILASPKYLLVNSS